MIWKAKFVRSGLIGSCDSVHRIRDSIEFIFLFADSIENWVTTREEYIPCPDKNIVPEHVTINASTYVCVSVYEYRQQTSLIIAHEVQDRWD